MRYFRLTDAIRRLGVSRGFVEALIDEGAVEPKRSLDGDWVLSDLQLDLVRVARLLVEEMGVNLEGATIILHMRAEMIAMRQQWQRVLVHLAERLGSSPGRRDPAEGGGRGEVTGWLPIRYGTRRSFRRER